MVNRPARQGSELGFKNPFQLFNLPQQRSVLSQINLGIGSVTTTLPQSIS
jgi:hypothetical protein